ncbi:tail fiber domain-containing protein [Rufibacter latericius]|uniref:T9SS C-terminal target domain-containing protein n=1 Tax=Rufibacter latericius TaxID=2487040 RepID=A0A3M9MUS2_9BACT|nr:tail fiber domain-containing protein [Rufibacter latericius]RNI28945.1 T9SS C-terminal target domain-containing protein [Rufibacter latericius]
MKKTLLSLFTLLLLGEANAQSTTPYWSLAGNSNAGTAKLGTTNGVHLRFFTNNQERMRINAFGLVSIGSSTPNAKLYINSPAREDPLRVLVNNSTKLLVHKNGGVSVGYNQTPPHNGLMVNGNVALGTTELTPFYRLQVIGQSNTNGILTKGSAYAIQAESTTDSGIGVFSIAGKNGTGVHTYAGYIGVSAIGNSYGVYAQSAHTGIYGSGDVYGVHGITNSGWGVFGSSSKGAGVYGRGFEGTGGYFTSLDGTGLFASTTNGTYAAVFEGQISSFGSFQSSDQNMKKNVQEVENALSLVNQLKPKKYEFKDDAVYAKLNLPKGNHYGLLAQEVEKVLPDLVRESRHEVVDQEEISTNASLMEYPDKKEMNLKAMQPKAEKETISLKAVNYTELVPLLIKAIQEQQETITSLTERISQLESNAGAKTYLDVNKSGILLEQNHPNPFNQATTFRYTIPPGASAQINVYEAVSGKLMKTIPAPAEGRLQMSGNDLPAGNYVYTLIVNGRTAASKHMMVAR